MSGRINLKTDGRIRRIPSRRRRLGRPRPAPNTRTGSEDCGWDDPEATPSGGSSSGADLTVLLPAHNEANSIEQVIKEFREQVVLPTGADFLVCEDGSTDGTDRVLRVLAAAGEIRLLNDVARKGYGDAVRDGLRTIRTPWTFFADSDGQYDARDFWKLWPHVGSYDMIIGRKVERMEHFHRILLSRGFHALVKAVADVPLQDMDCGFRIVRKAVVDAILDDIGSLPFSFWAEFSILAYRRGFRVLEVPVSHRPRLNGTTSIYNAWRLPLIVAQQARGLASLARQLRRADARK